MKEQEPPKDEGEEAADLKITVRGGCTSNCPKISACFWCSGESCFVNRGSVLDASLWDDHTPYPNMARGVSQCWSKHVLI